jgi:hypothetical protein
VGFPLSGHDDFQCRAFEQRVGHQTLELIALFFQGLESFGIGYIYAAKLGFPLKYESSEKPCLRRSSPAMAALASFRTPMICSS